MARLWVFITRKHFPAKYFIPSSLSVSFEDHLKDVRKVAYSRVLARILPPSIFFSFFSLHIQGFSALRRFSLEALFFSDFSLTIFCQLIDRNQGLTFLLFLRLTDEGKKLVFDVYVQAYKIPIGKGRNGLLRRVVAQRSCARNRFLRI